MIVISFYSLLIIWALCYCALQLSDNEMVKEMS